MAPPVLLESPPLHIRGIGIILFLPKLIYSSIATLICMRARA